MTNNKMTKSNMPATVSNALTESQRRGLFQNTTDSASATIGVDERGERAQLTEGRASMWPQLSLSGRAQTQRESLAAILDEALALLDEELFDDDDAGGESVGSSQ
ncbi:expressed unknown protein [Seminavis robusta]|uniref:Uncharacterized protein n=1 Tax=Seminavis robusta TaxID=568900 RepID=A0A9N8EBY1_9STRA|nr:expressed unknown protein [Seminavis robusta]|eukprot:Sro783_g201940.1 n/a (105) ;mRNA; r:37429-37743